MGGGGGVSGCQKGRAGELSRVVQEERTVNRKEKKRVEAERREFWGDSGEKRERKLKRLG